jgi:hypothetical protein
MATITITWNSFTKPTQSASATISFDYNAEVFSHNQICDIVFEQTNLYQGALWNVLEPALPADRTHTALSVGDEVTIFNHNTGFTYRCAHFGWELIGVDVNGNYYTTTQLGEDEYATEQLSAIFSPINAPLDARSN